MYNSTAKPSLFRISNANVKNDLKFIKKEANQPIITSRDMFGDSLDLMLKFLVDIKKDSKS